MSKVDSSVLTVSGSYTFDYFENISGGFQNGGAGMGLLDIGLEVDLERLFGWKDTTFVVSSFTGHGRDFSAEVVGDLGVVSNIFSDTEFNIFNIHLHKEFEAFGSNKNYFKLGQIAADDEFMIADTAGLFINSSFGPFNTQSANVGAPIFPLGAPGAVVHLAPSDKWFFQAGIYAGDAGPGGSSDRGFDWEWGGAAGVVVFAEAGVQINELGGVVKVGGFYHTGDFDEIVTGETVDGLGAIWTIVDQPIIASSKGEIGVNVFGRASIAPQDDRATATGQFDGGLVISNIGFKGAQFGIGATHTTFGDDFAEVNGVTDSETVIEMTYLIPVNDYFAIQPDIQYIGSPNESDDDAFVLGVRGSVSF